jgi:hypothetical protein
VDDRDPVLAAFRASTTDLTMLPSGVEVRLEEVPVIEMVRSSFLPGQLMQLAMQFASSQGVDPEKLDDPERAKWEDLERQMICRWVVSVSWTCECADCGASRAVAKVEPFRDRPWPYTPDQLAADPPPIGRVNLVALRDIVVFARTATMVDATSRVAHGLMDPDAAARVIEEEAANTLAGWSRFRHQRSGLDDGAHGEDVGRAPVGVPGSGAPAPTDHLPPARPGAGRQGHQRKRPARRRRP